jgi:hypothetical protein
MLVSSFFAPKGLRSAKEEIFLVSTLGASSIGLESSFFAPKGFLSDTEPNFLGSGFVASSVGCSSTFFEPNGFLLTGGFAISLTETGSSFFAPAEVYFGTSIISDFLTVSSGLAWVSV